MKCCREAARQCSSTESCSQIFRRIIRNDPGDVSLQVDVLEKVTIGVLLGGYEATRFKNKPTLSVLQSLEILAVKQGGDATAAITRGEAFARGAILARYKSLCDAADVLASAGVDSPARPGCQCIQVNAMSEVPCTPARLWNHQSNVKPRAKSMYTLCGSSNVAKIAVNVL